MDFAFRGEFAPVVGSWVGLASINYSYPRDGIVIIYSSHRQHALLAGCLDFLVTLFFPRFDPQKKIKIFSGCRATGGGIEENTARGQVRDSAVGCRSRLSGSRNRNPQDVSKST